MSFKLQVFLDLRKQEFILMLELLEEKMKVNYQYGMAIQFLENRGVLGEKNS